MGVIANGVVVTLCELALELEISGIPLTYFVLEWVALGSVRRRESALVACPDDILG